MKSLFMATVVALCLVGCSDVPECSDSDVKELVMDITKQKMYKGILNDNGNIQVLAVEYDKDGNEEDDYKRVQKLDSTITAKSFADSPAMALLKMKRSKYKAVKVAMENLKIDAIRTASVDENTEKSTCKAQLKSGEKTIDIRYTAQTTSDGELFVEVYGL